jgi:hypothetical protein
MPNMSVQGAFQELSGSQAYLEKLPSSQHVYVVIRTSSNKNETAFKTLLQH